MKKSSATQLREGMVEAKRRIASLAKEERSLFRKIHEQVTDRFLAQIQKKYNQNAKLVNAAMQRVQFGKGSIFETAWQQLHQQTKHAHTLITPTLANTLQSEGGAKDATTKAAMADAMMDKHFAAIRTNSKPYPDPNNAQECQDFMNTVFASPQEARDMMATFRDDPQPQPSTNEKLALSRQPNRDDPVQHQAVVDAQASSEQQSSDSNTDPADNLTAKAPLSSEASTP